MKRPDKKNYKKSNEGFEEYVKDLGIYASRLEEIKPSAEDVYYRVETDHYEDFEEWYENYGS